MSTTSTFDLTGLGDGAPAGFAVLERATAEVEPPFAVVDLEALAINARSLVMRAAGKPVRLATKSVRCEAIARAVLQLDGFTGILALTLPEALMLAEWCDDVVVGYPTANRDALRQLGSSPELADRITLMVDSVEQLELIQNTVGPGTSSIRLCIDLDASLRLARGRVHLGMRRSPLHTPAAAHDLAQLIVQNPRFRLVGLMAYEGQVAGVGDNAGSPLRKLQMRALRAASVAELAERRAAAVEAVRAVAELEFVNGGGTGSIESTAAESAVTELAAGSGLYGPALFDGYRGFRPEPAAFFVNSIVRRPSGSIATSLGGGWTASGAAGRDRLPTPVWPRGLRLLAMEGAGEAQTPLAGGGALRVGDRVWFRHAKAGELCERVNELHLVHQDRIVASVPTYRGEGHAFL